MSGAIKATGRDIVDHNTQVNALQDIGDFPDAELMKFARACRWLPQGRYLIRSRALEPETPARYAELAVGCSPPALCSSALPAGRLAASSATVRSDCSATSRASASTRLAWSMIF